MTEIINKDTGEMLEVIKENESGQLVVTKDACDVIVLYETQMKEIKKQYDTYKRALLEAMEAYGIKKIDTDDFVVTYVEPTERITLDSKRVEKEYPEVYEECMKVSDVKSSVRVKLRR